MIPQETKLLLSTDTIFEVRACLQASITMGLEVIRCSYENLDKLEAKDLVNCLPVGSVEFISKCLNILGKPIPANISYPEELKSFLRRPVDEMTIGSLLYETTLDKVFIKPKRLKLFNGFIFNRECSYDAHDLDQWKIVQQLAKDEVVWVSLVIDIDQEWRFYVQSGYIVGMARYDDGDTQDNLLAAMEIAQEALKECAIAHPYTIDIGILKDGSSVLIECNDAWAIGLYRGAMTPTQYVNYLYARWLTV